MKKITRLAAALFAAFTLATQIPASASSTNYTILDSYTGGVPTGTSYQELEYYNQYVDAGSVDASPFVIDKTTANSGGILFYGSTQLISAANANTFRLTSTTGAFDFTSFNLQDLESNQAYGTNTIPTMTVTASTGFTQTWSASALPPPSDPGPVFYSFDDSGVKTMNLSGVDWVDFTTQYTKAKTSDFVLTAGARPSGSSAEPTNYTILDSYNGNGVPTGTSYQEAEYYNQYVDAFSVDHSPFVLTRTTTANSGGILFYGSTELISAANANTFRLTSTGGAFDFKSFNLQDLEGNGAYASNEIPTLTITSSLGQSQTWSSTYDEFFPGFGMFSFHDSGVKTMNWSGVDWVDFTTQYTKAKTSEFALTAGARPSGSFGDLAIGTTAVTAPNSTVAEVSGTATVNVDSTGTTISNVTGGTVNVKGANTTIQSYNGGNVGVDRGLTVAMNDGNSSGVISGGGGMTKNSAGTLTLGGVNTYTGATTVGGGLLVVNGSIASSPVTIQSGGTLGGSGTVGALTVESGGTINPGNSIGAIDAGSTALGGGGAFTLEVFDWLGSEGTGWDILAVNGDLTLNSTTNNQFTINLVSLQNTNTPGMSTNWNAANSFTNRFISYTGSLLGASFSPDLFTVNTGGFQNPFTGTFSVANVAGGLALTYTPTAAAVPEPGTWAAAALLVGAAGYVRWRKRKIS